MVLFEMAHELMNGSLVRFLEKRLVDGIVFDDVDKIGGHLAVNLYQFVGVLAAVVKPLEQDIFKGDLASRPFVKVVQCFDECLDVVGLIDGHDLVSFLVVGGVEGECQFEFDLVVAQLADHFGHARGGDGDAAGAHGEAVRRGDSFDGTEDVPVVQQRFAHAHENNITQLLFEYFFALLVDEHDLIVDLVEFEVSFPVHIAGRAEFATQGTADLGGNAGGFAFVGGDEDTLHEVAVGGAEAAFDGAVAAVLGSVDGKRGEGEGISELLAKGFADVRHVVERVGVFLPEPFVDLFGPKLLLAEGVEVCFDLRVSQVPDILLHFFHAGRKDTKIFGAVDGLLRFVSKADRELY